MTAILALRDGDRWIIASDNSLFDEVARYEASEPMKVWRQPVLGPSRVQFGEAVVASAGTTLFGQTIRYHGLPVVKGAKEDASRWQPTTRYLFFAADAWRQLCLDKGMMDNESQWMTDGTNETLIAVRGKRENGPARLWTMDSSFCVVPQELPYVGLGCAGATMNGVAATLLARSVATEDIIEEAFDVARRHHQDVGDSLFIESLGG